MFEMLRSAGLKRYTHAQELEFKSELQKVAQSIRFGDNFKLIILIAMLSVDTKGKLPAIDNLRAKLSRVLFRRWQQADPDSKEDDDSDSDDDIVSYRITWEDLHSTINSIKILVESIKTEYIGAS